MGIEDEILLGVSWLGSVQVSVEAPAEEQQIDSDFYLF
jgi:hypothetical protein